MAAITIVCEAKRVVHASKWIANKLTCQSKRDRSILDALITIVGTRMAGPSENGMVPASKHVPSAQGLYRTVAFVFVVRDPFVPALLDCVGNG